jgi:uncharacterized protein YpuA (DUF1002 family)
MLREFVELVTEAVNDGYQKGLNLFVESIESDLERESIYEEYGIDDVIAHVFNESNINLSGDQIDDIDALIDELEQDVD